MRQHQGSRLGDDARGRARPGVLHVSDKNSLMYPFDSGFCRAGALSAAESFHAAIAYSRPRQNTDPDKDPASFRSFGARAEGPLVER